MAQIKKGAGEFQRHRDFTAKVLTASPNLPDVQC
jgi:hypothetical protein